MSIHERVRKLERQVEWLTDQLKNGMTDIAVTTVTKILEEGLEAEVKREKSTDEKIKELIK